MTWNVVLELEPQCQQKSNYCGAACVQMVLSTMGLRGLDPVRAQSAFYSSANVWNGPGAYGRPVGVAATINRYNTGISSYLPVPPVVEFREHRTPAPYEACATVVNALVDHNAASVVMVLGSTHWIVVHGGAGDGTPCDGSPYEIEVLLICNPDNGFFHGIPGGGTEGATAPGFIDEWITYADFLYTYFSGCNDGAPPSWGVPYADGRQFVIVTDDRARAQGDLRLPPAQGLAPSVSAADALAAFAKSPFAADLANAKHEKPLRVRRTDRDEEYYYLVPFALPDGIVRLVRLDSQGSYLGSASGHAEVRTFADPQWQLDLVSEWAARHGKRSRYDRLRADETLVWQPSVESASPYNVFRRVGDGAFTVYVSWGGSVMPALHDRQSGLPLTP